MKREFTWVSLRLYPSQKQVTAVFFFFLMLSCLPGVISSSTLRATYSNWSTYSLRKFSAIFSRRITTSSKPRPRCCAHSAVMWCVDEMLIWFGVSMDLQHRLKAISSDQQFCNSKIWSSVYLLDTKKKFFIFENFGYKNGQSDLYQCINL